MVKYLENNICDFELLFDINYNKKVNILSTCFFKMGKHYKNFSIYVNGLKKIVKMLDKQDRYVLRIFIDENIRDDKEIFDVLKSSNKIQIVIFKCHKYMEGNYHVDVFGALVRLFPVFNFNNNDAENVIVIDIDLNNEDTRSLKKLLYYETNKKQIIGKGMTNNLIIRKIRPHFFCNLIGFYNHKYDTKVITNFITNAHNILDKGAYDKREKPFGFGTDELFLNNYFIYKDDDISKVELGIIYNYDINWFIFHYKDELLKDEPKITREYIIDILGRFGDVKLSTEELINILDQKIYGIEPTNPDKILLSKNYYKLIKRLVNEKKEWFDFENLKLIDKYYSGIVESISIMFFNRDTLDIYKVVNLGQKRV